MVEVLADGAETGAYGTVAGRRHLHLVVDCPEGMGGEVELKLWGMTLGVGGSPVGGSGNTRTGGSIDATGDQCSGQCRSLPCRIPARF